MRTLMGMSAFCERRYSAGSPAVRSSGITASNCFGEWQATASTHNPRTTRSEYRATCLSAATYILTNHVGWLHDLFAAWRSRNEQRIEFLGEQDGPAERELKARLVEILRAVPAVDRAYLARVGYQPHTPPAVALCLSASRPDPSIVRSIREPFASLFARNAFMDVFFVDDAQETDLARVCSPFYGRSKLDSGVR